MMNKADDISSLNPDFLPELTVISCLIGHTRGHVFLCLKALFALFH